MAIDRADADVCRRPSAAVSLRCARLVAMRIHTGPRAPDAAPRTPDNDSEPWEPPGPLALAVPLDVLALRCPSPRCSSRRAHDALHDDSGLCTAEGPKTTEAVAADNCLCYGEERRAR